MKTKVVKIDPLAGTKENYLKQAVDVLVNGGLVIIPTETVYGIAANKLNQKAIDRLYEIKKRPKDKPFSLHIADKEKVENYAESIPISAYKLIDRFWPGPLTLILKAKDGGTLGLRMPDDGIALDIILRAKVPLVCPSANISGRNPPVNFSEAIKDLDGLVDLAIDAGNTKLGLESTVVDLVAQPLRILREGAIKKEDIEKVVRRKTVLFICTGNSCRSVMAQGLLRKKLKEQGRQDEVEILSAGIMMAAGLGVTDETKEILAQEGIDASGHSSQKVSESMIRKSDFILVMEKLHEEIILELCPEVKNRLFLLKEFAKIKDNNLDIEDPISRPRDFYAQTFRVIKEAIESVSKII